MALVAREHTMTATNTDKQSPPLDSLGATSFVLYVDVPSSWDRAATVTVDVSPDGAKWSPGAVGGTASPITQAVAATDDGKLFFVAATGAHRFLRINYDNTTAGTVGTITMKLVIAAGAKDGWISTSS